MIANQICQRFLAIAACFVLLWGCKSTTKEADIAEYEKEIRLPVNDTHLNHVKSYIENDPDPDYRHAPPSAQDAFRDIKFAVRIHWGLYSIHELNHESWKFLEFSNEKKQAYLDSYKDFNPVDFNADRWMEFFKRAGLRCFAFTTKHHDGFSLFDTREVVRQRVNYLAPGGPAIEACSTHFSVMESPFRRDIVKELCEAGRRAGMKIDLYFSHPDWYDADFRPYAYHPLQTEDIKNNPSDYGDPYIFQDNKNKIMVPEPSEEEKQRMISRHRNQLKELLTNYGPIDMICLDQYMGRNIWPELKQTIKELRKIQPNVMFRARGIGNYGDYYTPEGFVPESKENTAMPWMVIYPLASTFSYDKDGSNYKGTKWIVHNLVDAVSKGGNFMVGIGPDGRGNFHPKAVEQLDSTGVWLQTNGEGIFDTKAAEIWKEGDNIRYTQSKDGKHFYAFSLEWPGNQLELKNIEPEKGSKILLLGEQEPLEWTYENGSLIIRIPDAIAEKAVQQGLAWTFKIVGKQKK